MSRRTGTCAMRALPTLGAYCWLVAAAALPTAQAQQLSPPTCTPPAGGPPTNDWLSSCWLSSVTDLPNDYWAEQARNWERRQRLFFSFSGRGTGSSPGKGDYWKPGEFDRLIGPR